MTGSSQDLLYQLLPALYRDQDEHQGEPLRALMALLEREYRRLEEDMGAAYDNWFIETCDRWVVPYIADLLGVRHLQDVSRLPRQRSLVANTIAYRRRKGTAAVLEHAIRDATGWHAQCVEDAQRVAATQHVRRARSNRGRLVDVRRLDVAAETGEAGDKLAYTVDVTDGETSKHDQRSIGVFLWRLRSYLIARSPARPIRRDKRTGRQLPPGCYTFDPLGRDVPLFNHPHVVTRVTDGCQPHNLPLRLSRADLEADLEAYRLRYGSVETAEWRPVNSRLYGPDRSLSIEQGGRAIPPSSVVSMDLSQWPAAGTLDSALVAVDVERGRFAFVDAAELPAHLAPAVQEGRIIPVDVGDGLGGAVITNYTYGFSGEIGGGPYSRQYALHEPAPGTKQVYVAKGSEIDTLQKALDQWNEHVKGDQAVIGRITFLDNGLYGGRGLEVVLPRGAQLTITAAEGVRPIIRPFTRLEVKLAFPAELALVRIGRPEPEEEVEPEAVIDRLLHLNGLVIRGGMRIDARPSVDGKLDAQIHHCTLMPDGVEVLTSPKDAARLSVDIQHSIVGPLRLPAEVAALTVRDSIIDHAAGHAITMPASADRAGEPPGHVSRAGVTLRRTTVLGQVCLQEIRSASDVIFTEPVLVEERQRGTISFSHVPMGSRTPPCAFCQPSDEVSADEVRPRFTSVRFGDPAYAQLSPDCPREIRGGAADGSEMGAFHDAHELLAEENLREVLRDYVPLGLRASIRYVT